MVSGPPAQQSDEVLLPSAPAGAIARWLPRGRALAAQDFAWRHRVVTTVLALHVPVVVLAAGLRGRGAVDALLVSLPLVLLLAAALLPTSRATGGRQRQALAASLGLLLSSSLVGHLFNSSPEAQFHYFVAVAVVALYQDWVVYLLAVALVGLQSVPLGRLDAHPVAYAGEPGNPWLRIAIHAAFILAESGVLVVFWKANEQAHASTDRLQSQLFEGSTSVRARLEEADQIRADLIATVSHEFRTPLTGIRGAALTLLKRGDRLDTAAREQLLHAVLDQEERLFRTLENMLVAAEATAADPSAVAEVDAVAAEVAMLAGAVRADVASPTVVVTPGTLARIDRKALHQVVANLLDNAQQHGRSGAVAIIAGGEDARGVWLTVSNEGPGLDVTQADRLFEPFTQAASGPTRDREGMGMGLYVVRRLVEVHGGSIDVRSGDGWVSVQVRLRSVVPGPLRDEQAYAS